MEVDKRSSKGGFLSLFDWNGKSRKKLFSNNSDVPDGMKHGKENMEVSTKSRLQMNSPDNYGVSLNSNESGDWNCTSSVTSDEGYGSRAPGVVARLMGLDSLPVPGAPDPCVNSFSESNHPGDFHYDTSTPTLKSIYSAASNLNLSIEGNSHPYKMQNRPVEKFQRELLPPKSAKPISVSSNKLLSPIKSPGFVPSKDAAHIMEAAAKIIEGQPRAVMRGKAPLVVSPPVPLKLWELKLKMDGGREIHAPKLPKPKEHPAVKSTKETKSTRNSVQSVKDDSNIWKTKGRSSFVADQTKVNVQKGERKGLIGNRDLANDKERSEGNLNRTSNFQRNLQKSTQMRSSGNRRDDVLKQNNQKQNSLTDRRTSVSKASINEKTRRTQFTNGTTGPGKNANKASGNIRSRSSRIASMKPTKELPLSSSKTSSGKKGYASSDFPSKRNIATNVLISSGCRYTGSNTNVDGNVDWGLNSNRKGMDVVSFTFTSPVKRNHSETQSSSQVTGTDDGTSGTCGRYDKSGKDMIFSSPSGSTIGGNSLNFLLEQKLRELTDRIESTSFESFQEDKSFSSPSSVQGLLSTLDSVSSTSRENESSSQTAQDKDSPCSLHDFDRSLVDGSKISTKQMHQQVQASEARKDSGHHGSSNRTLKELDYQNQSPDSFLEPLFCNRNCQDGMSTQQCDEENSYAPSPEVSDCLSATEFPICEDDAEVTCSTSSSFMTDAEEKHVIKASLDPIFSAQSGNWELEYLREVIQNERLNPEDFAFRDKIIRTNLFDEMENREYGQGEDADYSKLRRKVLFDFMNEFLELKCGGLSVGAYKAWTAYATMVERKRWLADEVYKEILRLKCVGNMMVDELVDGDMSTQHGKWTDFTNEMFEEGVEIGNEILTSLVDELIADY